MANTNTKELRKFGMLDKLSYAAGDFGCNMSFALKGTLTIYWTQFMGVNQMGMAGLLLLVQIWDAINDPVIGSMVDADRRHYKRNKFLAYINVGAIGLTVAGACCFLPFPGMPELVKTILFVAGYVIWDAFYTVANVPYGSMMSLITDDPVQRSQLSTFRSAGSMIANLVTGSLLPVLIYDASNTLLGERVFWIALIMGGIGLCFFQFMIRTTVIRVDTEVKTGEEMPKFNVVKAMGAFIRNRAAVGASLAGMSSFIGMYGAQTAVTVMFQSYFKNARISGIVGMLSMFGVFIFMPFATTITKKIGKKEGCTIGAVVACLAYVLMFALPITPDGKGLALYVLCQVIAMIGNGYSSCVTHHLRAVLLLPQGCAGPRTLPRPRGRHRGWLQRHPWPRPARADRDQPALPRARHVPRRHRAGAGRLRPHLQRRPQDAESDERRPGPGLLPFMGCFTGV